MVATAGTRQAMRNMAASARLSTATRSSLGGNARTATRALTQQHGVVATSSRVTLAHLNSRTNRYPFASALQQPSRQSGGVQQRRSIVTMTRRPEQPEDPDVMAGGEEPSLIVTDRAIDHLSKVAVREKNNNLALRVAVEPGGCHGYQYKMELTEEVEDDDFRFSVGDKVHLLVDSTSLRLIKGSTIDYVTELIGSQFAIFHNPQAKGAGCGCGVSWEPIV